VAPEVRDAWVTARNVVLGAAFVRKGDGNKVEALSASCPHLGCPVGWESAKQSFLCPCHNSRFGAKGEIVGEGPAKRGLDPLPIEVRDGRLRLTWMTYKLDTPSREPA
jgi:quinol---cytochrome c reductase iron-sulfur subunit, bacillus type